MAESSFQGGKAEWPKNAPQVRFAIGRAVEILIAHLVNNSAADRTTQIPAELHFI